MKSQVDATPKKGAGASSAGPRAEPELGTPSDQEGIVTKGLPLSSTRSTQTIHNQTSLSPAPLVQHNSHSEISARPTSTAHDRSPSLRWRPSPLQQPRLRLLQSLRLGSWCCLVSIALF